jgi:hypothetical protein
MVFRRAAALLLTPVFGLCGCNLVLGVAAAFQPYYSGGGFEHEYGDRAHATQTIDCLDVAIDLTSEQGETVMEWRMGNRCNAPVRTDLSRLVLTERHHDSSTTPLDLKDPNGEMGPRDLAPRRAATERIALHGDPDHDAASVCIDASGVVDRGTAPPSPPLCFIRRDRWLARGPS